VIEIEASAQALEDRVSKIMRAIMANVAAGSDVSAAASEIESYVASLRRQASACSQGGPILTRVE